LLRVQVMDALNMEFADDSFDFVWACESGEHMPDKKAYVEEMARVLAPGGKVRRLLRHSDRCLSASRADAAESRSAGFRSAADYL
jgi:ubiquinone/menaquinone biosynthesis C-methylase UbiE